MTLISYLTQKLQSPFFRNAPPPYSHKGFDKLRFKKKAFTLAEVLITLTIIGVVAAMTIPTLMSKYQKHTYVVGLKKAYSQLTNAVKMIPITAGCPSGDYDCAGMFEGTTQIEMANQAMDLVAKQLKARRFESSDYKSGRYHSSEAYCNNTENSCYITDDGMIYRSYTGCMYTGTGPCIEIDVNGMKGNSNLGEDLFSFKIAEETQNGIPKGTVMPIGSKIYSKYYNSEDIYWKNGLSKGLYPDWEREALTGRVLEENEINYKIKNRW